MLVPGKMQHVICTGNVGTEQYEDLRELAPNLHVVQGDFGGESFPETRVVQVGQFRIGVIHGHQVIPWKSHEALARMRRKLCVDILISGHTHQNEVVEHDGHYHINPVSAILEKSEWGGEISNSTNCRDQLQEPIHQLLLM